MKTLDRLSSLLNRGLGFLSGLCLVAMMLVTVSDMVLRLLDRPLAGTYEIVGWLAAGSTALALGYTQLSRAHVAIDLVVVRLGSRGRAIVAPAVDLVSSLLFALVTWRVFLYAGVLRESGSLSETLKVIVYPWVYVVALGAAGLTLALVVDFLRSTTRALGRTGRA